MPRYALAKERARKREALLQDTGKILPGIADSVSRKGSKLRVCKQINHRVGRVTNRRKVEKHFDIVVTDDELISERNAEKSPPKRDWMVFISCAPVLARMPSVPIRQWKPVNHCPAWNEHSAT